MGCTQATDNSAVPSTASYPHVQPLITVLAVDDLDEPVVLSGAECNSRYYKAGQALGSTYHSFKVTAQQHQVPQKLERVAQASIKLGAAYEQKTGRDSRSDGKKAATGAAVVGGALLAVATLPMAVVGGAVGVGAVTVVAVAKSKTHKSFASKNEAQSSRPNRVTSVLKKSASKAAGKLGEVSKGVNDALQEAAMKAARTATSGASDEQYYPVNHAQQHYTANAAESAPQGMPGWHELHHAAQQAAAQHVETIHSGGRYGVESQNRTAPQASHPEAIHSMELHAEEGQLSQNRRAPQALHAEEGQRTQERKMAARQPQPLVTQVPPEQQGRTTYQGMDQDLGMDPVQKHQALNAKMDAVGLALEQYLLSTSRQQQGVGVEGTQGQCFGCGAGQHGGPNSEEEFYDCAATSP